MYRKTKKRKAKTIILKKWKQTASHHKDELEQYSAPAEISCFHDYSQEHALLITSVEIGKKNRK